MCKDAIVCIMTGCNYNKPHEGRFIFEKILTQIDDHLWFFLKTASAEITNELFISNFDGYQSFTLSDLRQKVFQEFGRDYFMSSPNLTEDEKITRYAKILFLVGQFNHGLIELVLADMLVETVVFGIALKERDLIITRSQLLQQLAANTMI